MKMIPMLVVLLLMFWLAAMLFASGCAGPCKLEGFTRTCYEWRSN